MTNEVGLLVIGCALVMVISAIFIVLNWLSLIAFIVQRRKGNFSFSPPFICGVLGAIASFGALNHHAAWSASVFLLLDPSIGFALGSIAIKSLRK